MSKNFIARDREFIQLFLGWGIGTFLSFLLGLMFVEIGERSELGTIEGAIVGAIVGTMQAIVLIPWLPRPWLWILINVLAWGFLGGSELSVIGWYAPKTEILSIRLAYGAIYGAIAGLWLGIWQWIVLRRYLFQAWRWIVVSLANWTIALSLGWIVGGMLRSMTRLFIGEVVGLAFTWLIVSILSSATLAILVREAIVFRRKFLKKAKSGLETERI
jgi:hypothetical protein